MEIINSNPDELQFNQVNRSYLLETAKWSKFLSILGFISVVIIIILGITAGFYLGAIMENNSGIGNSLKFPNTGFLSFIYIVIGVIYFFPCLYLYRFSTKMIRSLRSNEQEIFDQSLGNLKSSFKFIGILTIVVLSFYVLAIIMVAFIGLSVVHH